ncbi:MAG: alpha/beta fold hydrolase [Myxococcota bacterium]
MPAVYEDYPFESRFGTVDGQRLHYVDEGGGEPILMLHGNPTWSYLYRHLILGLRDTFRCVAPDHLGFGYSDKPRRGDYSMRAHIMRLDSFVDRLGLEDITLVGQDWGGIIGLGWAVRHKARVKRLILLNTSGFAPPDRKIWRRVRPRPWGLLMLLPLKIPILGELFVQGRNGFVRKLLPAGVHHKERLTPRVMEGYIDPYPTWGSRRAHLASVRQIPFTRRHPTWRLLQEIGAELDGWEVPAQMIWGMRDPIFVPWFLEEFERLLPNHAPSARIADAGHFLQDDTPLPIIDTIRAFMHQSAEAAPVASVAGA